MSPWIVVGGVLVGGALLWAGTAAAADDECEVTLEYGFPYWLCGVMLRKCETEAEIVWLWDVAAIDDVTFGADAMAIEDWPDRSLGFGQAADERAANEAALAWVDAHQSFVMTGGKRGPLAQRTDDFLASLTPLQYADLLLVFDAIDPRIEGWVDELRVAADDEAFMHTGNSIAAVVGRADQDKLQTDILDALGFSKAWELKGILEGAGVL